MKNCRQPVTKRGKPPFHPSALVLGYTRGSFFFFSFPLVPLLPRIAANPDDENSKPVSFRPNVPQCWEADRPDSTETAAYESPARDQADRQAGSCEVAEKRCIRAASDQPCAGSPGSRSERIRNLPKCPGRPSLVAHKEYLVQTTLPSQLKYLPGRPHRNSRRTRNIWPGQIDLAHKPKGRRSAGSRGLRTRGRANPKEMRHLFPRQQFNLFSVWILWCSRR